MYQRTKIGLNQQWFFKDGFHVNDLSTWNEEQYIRVELPHSNHLIHHSYSLASKYQKISLYSKQIQLDQLSENQVVYIHFEGVMNFCEVYIDQTLIGTHFGGFTAFSFDITEAVKDLNLHRLSVVVDATERTDFPPYGFVVDYLTYGGIYREVYLEKKPKSFIDDLAIITTQNQGELWNLDLYFSIANGTTKDYLVKLHSKHQDHQFSFYDRIHYEQGKYHIHLQTNPKIWDLDQPNLYQYELQLLDDEKIVDCVTGKLGFRSIRVDSKGFYLNQKHIKLIGLNRHQSYPYVGYAMPKRVQEQDANILKYDLGLNIVRSSHYPPSKHFLNRCDEIGLLVFEEIPGWQYIGNDEWKQHSLTHLREMILHDRNHPSVVIWGVRINESKDDTDFYHQTNRLAKQLDPTRPTGGVRNFGNSEFLEDIYTYNDFTHRGSNQGLLRRKQVIKKSVPYLVTEHNGHMFPTKKYDSELHRINHALRHLRVLNDMYGSIDIMGTIGWCMNDYHTHHDFGSGDLICHHGVMDMYRIPKFASYVYQSQHSKQPVLSVLSSLSIGEYPASNPTPIYIMTNCDYVEVYKQEKKIGRYYPDQGQFANLPHPPVIIDDLIGNAIEENESFSKKDASRIKNILNVYRQFGFQMPIKYKLMMGLLMAKYKIDMEKATNLFGTYLGDWGNPSTKYKFVGFIKDKEVCSVTKTQVIEAKLQVKADDTTLRLGDTFDATRIVAKCVDQFGNDLVYIHESLYIEITGSLELIGPNQISLIGGSIAFWVKTTDQVGMSKIVIHSHQFGLSELHIEVV